MKKANSRVDWLESFIKGYEEGANEILKCYKGKIKEILDYEKKNPFGDSKKVNDARRIINSRHILFRCARLRDSVRKNDPRRIVYDVAWIVSLAYNVGLSKIIAAILGRIKGGQANKKRQGIIEAIKDSLEKIKVPKSTPGLLWNFFKRNYPENNPLNINGFEIFYHDDDLIFQCDIDGREKSIKYKTFERYCYEILKENS